MNIQRFRPSKENLYYEYWVLKKSINDIAQEHKCNRATVGIRLKEYNIPIRSCVEASNTPLYIAKIKQITKGNQGARGYHHTEEWKCQKRESMKSNTNKTGKPNTREGIWGLLALILRGNDGTLPEKLDREINARFSGGI